MNQFKLVVAQVMKDFFNESSNTYHDLVQATDELEEEIYEFEVSIVYYFDLLMPKGILYFVVGIPVLYFTSSAIIKNKVTCNSCSYGMGFLLPF